MQLNETTLQQLYNSIVKAFPSTTLRQYATDPIKVSQLSWIPYKGLKTLFVKGLAQNEGKEYNTIILFKNVNYLENSGIKLRANDGLIYNLEPLSLSETDVLVRCNCPDFRYRFSFYNFTDHSLYGRKPKKYEGSGGFPANPKELPGVCKHILKTVKVLREAKILT